MSLELPAGAGSELGLAERPASETPRSRELHATPTKENPIANMAAPSALTATQRVFSEPDILLTSTGRKRRMLLPSASAGPKLRAVKMPGFCAQGVALFPQRVSPGPQTDVAP